MNVIPHNYVKIVNVNLHDLYNYTENYTLNVNTNFWETNLVNVLHISSIGNILYSVYSILFLLLAIILLLSMVGCIIITINSTSKDHSLINSPLTNS